MPGLWAFLWMVGPKEWENARKSGTLGLLALWDTLMCRLETQMLHVKSNRTLRHWSIRFYFQHLSLQPTHACQKIDSISSLEYSLLPLNNLSSQRLHPEKFVPSEKGQLQWKLQMLLLFLFLKNFFTFFRNFPIFLGEVTKER